MTYEEALERNLRNDVDAQLIPYMAQIAAENEELDLETEGELIDTAAEKMLLAEMEGDSISTAEALEQARKEEKNRPAYNAMLKQIQKHLEEEMELRGINPIPDSDTLNMILNTPDEEPKDTAPKLNAKVARESLTRMAESLRTESCLYDIHYFHDNELWKAILRFTDGYLSAEAQSTLIQMKHNAHRMMLNQNKNLKVVTFVVAG